MPGCSEVSGLLDDYVDETASPLARTAVEHHLTSCERCRRLARERLCIRRLLRRLPREPMPAAMKQQLLAAFRSSPLPAVPPAPQRSRPPACSAD